MKKKEVAFDEFLSDEWSEDLDTIEVPLRNRVLVLFGIFVGIIGIFVMGRLLFLGVARAELYTRQATRNLKEQKELHAPRGVIYDRNDEVLVDNTQDFLLFVDIDEFLKHPELEEETFEALGKAGGITRGEFWKLVQAADLERTRGKILMRTNLDVEDVIALQGSNLPTLSIEEGFRRIYEEGRVFSSIVGYTGLVSPDDLERNPSLSNQAIVGRAGLEKMYDAVLRGTPGAVVQFRDAKGNPIGEPEVKRPEIGASLHLTIDADFQRYFARRFEEMLRMLGRTTGVGLAIRPRTGEVLALLNFPTFDSDAFVRFERNNERKEILQSADEPLFNRAIAGLYNPGSTVKPLLAIAALREGVITPEEGIFSPGYLDVPNPYDADRPSRFLDWRPQGWVNMTSAIAQSSNVYFYIVGGGGEGRNGLGITRLRKWWSAFRFGLPAGIDLPGEAAGHLPTPEEKVKKTGEPWRLGDTYNVSIGQGDLLVTPLGLLNYIAAIATKGKMYRPFLVKDMRTPTLIADLSSFVAETKEAEKGMIEAVQSPLGTAHFLSDLPFRIAAKTGTAQISGNAQENAFFVGYAPVEDPQIAILVLVERSQEGSLNAVPIAKDALSWYYWNRIRK